jgi:hypothetical protein
MIFDFHIGNTQNQGRIWVIIKKHALFCYYAIKRQISTKLIGENMFCMKAHQPALIGRVTPQT